MIDVSRVPGQRTLCRSASLAGTALHTGEAVTLYLHPAPIDHGLRFRRIDLPDKPVIEAHIRHAVSGAEGQTKLRGQGVEVHTTEHVLSALWGMGIDDALIELDGLEVPIMDGSAKPFVDLIEQCGIVGQDAQADVFELQRPVHIETTTGSVLIALPCRDSGLRISCTFTHQEHPQFASLRLTPDVYALSIASSRTFVSSSDIDTLRQRGLIKGGSLDNAIVLGMGGNLDGLPWRVENELAGHKILDLIGDLAMLGKRLNAHVVAIRPGHAANAELVRALIEDLEASKRPKL